MSDVADVHKARRGSHAGLRRLGRGTCTAGLATGLFAMLGSLKPFQFGFWPQAEPMAVGVHAAGLLTTIGLIFLAVAEPRRLSHCIRHPFVAIPAAIALLSFGFALIIETPGLSIFGFPAIGVGALSHLCLACMILAALMIRTDKTCLRLLQALAVLAVLLIVTLLLVFGRGSLWSPFWFTDYVAFPALFLAAGMMAWVNGTTVLQGLRWHLVFLPLALVALLGLTAATEWSSPHSGLLLTPVFFIPVAVHAFQGRRDILLPAFGLAAATALLWVSDNKTAILGVPCAALAALVVWKLANRWPTALKPVCAIVVVALPFLVTGVAYQSAAFSTLGQEGQPLASIPRALSEVLDTNWDRARLVDLVLGTYRDTPTAILTGHGWGSFTDLLAGGLLLDSVNLVSQGQAHANWLAIHWSHWHSHNLFLEALVGCGVLGLLLSLLWVASFVTHARQGLRWLGLMLALSYAGIASMWFELPGVMAFTALGLAVIAGGRPRSAFVRRARGVTPTIAIGTMVISAGVLASAIAIAVVYGVRVERWKANQFALSEIALTEASRAQAIQRLCNDLASDFQRGGHHLAALYNRALGEFSEHAATNTGVRPIDLALLEGYACAADRWPTVGRAQLGVTTTLAMSELAFLPNNTSQDPRVLKLLTDWDSKLVRVLERYPERVDLTAPYYQWQLARGEEATMLEFAKQRLDKSRDDPMALWFSGIVLLGDPVHAQEGARRMKRALLFNADRLTPISEDVQETVRGFVTDN